MDGLTFIRNEREVDRLAAALRATLEKKKPDERLRVEWKLGRSKRSLEQNAYWWAVVVPLAADAMGYERDKDSLDEVSRALCAGYFGVREITVQPGPFAPASATGTTIVVPAKTTSQLDVREFTDLVDWALHACAELGYVPPPGSDWLT